MAKYLYGINGPISGKVGAVVGARWKNKYYLRSLPRKSAKPRTIEQVANQSAFGFVSSWLKPLTTLVNVGYENFSEDCTARNCAQSYNLKHTLIKTTEGYQIDYTKARFSEGPLVGSSHVDLAMKDEQTLLISWNTDTRILEEPSGQHAGSDGDSVMYFVYFPEFKEALIEIGSCKRKDGQAEVKIPARWRNKRLEVQIAFKSPVTNEVSTSQYAGGLNSDDVEVPGGQAPGLSEPMVQQEPRATKPDVEETVWAAPQKTHPAVAKARNRFVDLDLLWKASAGKTEDSAKCPIGKPGLDAPKRSSWPEGMILNNLAWGYSDLHRDYRPQ